MKLNECNLVQFCLRNLLVSLLAADAWCTPFLQWMFGQKNGSSCKQLNSAATATCRNYHSPVFCQNHLPFFVFSYSMIFDEHILSVSLIFASSFFIKTSNFPSHRQKIFALNRFPHIQINCGGIKRETCYYEYCQNIEDTLVSCF